MPLDNLPVTSPVIEKLRAGLALIIERGWAQGRVEDVHGRLCLVGGIVRQSRVEADAAMAALVYLSRAIPAELAAMAAWNDAPDRIFDDVIAAYGRAIDSAVADEISRRKTADG